MFDFRRATLFHWGYRLSKQKMTTYSKNCGRHGPLTDVVSYCVKRSMSESVAVLPYVWKIHYNVRLALSATNVPEWIAVSGYANAGFFSHSIKLRCLLDIPLWKACENKS